MTELPKLRLWVDRVAPGALVLDAEQSHYVRNVLRLDEGDAVSVVASDGGLGSARVCRCTREAVELEVLHVARQAPPQLALTVAICVPKGERADWTVEKLTELGVSKILWTTGERSVVVPRPGGQRSERWQRIAQAAARQASRAGTPEIEGPVATTALWEMQAEARLIAHPGGEPLTDVNTELANCRTAIVAIGPEGGFTPRELLQAEAAGYRRVALGPHILRVETAAITSAAILLCGAQLCAQPENVP